MGQTLFTEGQISGYPGATWTAATGSFDDGQYMHDSLWMRRTSAEIDPEVIAGPRPGHYVMEFYHAWYDNLYRTLDESIFYEVNDEYDYVSPGVAAQVPQAVHHFNLVNVIDSNWFGNPLNELPYYGKYRMQIKELTPGRCTALVYWKGDIDDYGIKEVWIARFNNPTSASFNQQNFDNLITKPPNAQSVSVGTEQYQLISWNLEYKQRIWSRSETSIPEIFSSGGSFVRSALNGDDLAVLISNQDVGINYWMILYVSNVFSGVPSAFYIINDYNPPGLQARYDLFEGRSSAYIARSTQTQASGSVNLYDVGNTLLWSNSTVGYSPAISTVLGSLGSILEFVVPVPEHRFYDVDRLVSNGDENSYMRVTPGFWYYVHGPKNRSGAFVGRIETYGFYFSDFLFDSTYMISGGKSGPSVGILWAASGAAQWGMSY